MNEADVQVFLNLAIEIDAAFSEGNSVTLRPNTDLSAALKMARRVIETEFNRRHNVLAPVILEPQLDNPFGEPARRRKNKPKKAVHKDGGWSESTSKSGAREWIVGEGFGTLESEDIFQCGGKIPFKTLQEAEKQASKYSQFRQERFLAYGCRYCRSFHIGGDR
jgi:hypothetical protein